MSAAASPDRDARADRRTYGQIAALAVGVRAALYAGCWLWLHDPLQTLLRASDGISYLRVARLIYGAGPGAADVAAYDSRVFLTWPLIFGWTRILGHEIRGQFLFTLLAAVAAPCLMFALTRSRRLAVLMSVAPPAWLLSTTFPMSEGPCLVLALLSALAVLGGRDLLAGLAAGFLLAGRPFGAALVAGEAWALGRGGGRRLVTFAAALLVGPALTVVLDLHFFGDPLHQVAVYAMPLAGLNVGPQEVAALGHPAGHWGLPFVALATTPWRVPAPAWKVAYIYANVAIVLWASWRAWRSLRRRQAADVDVMLGVWLIGNTGFAMCGGPYWGFFSFDRWCVWALPAWLWSCRDLFERGRRVTAAIGITSVGLAAWALSRYL